ncbi:MULTISPECIES: hypothetical protein [Peribacillus]|uniref:hypothetical protein n=1 Tax=Peribacillus TaxID=2675229 RepID=UPI002B24B56D|nr:hypothetical protein [Peribacillus frigoritolerans]MEB2628065.1 hypothetical protein [Peribacillus frigoritolerans]QYF80552.1 hypothetical protein KY492_16505 [Brevibacterium sp. PAMC21349]
MEWKSGGFSEARIKRLFTYFMGYLSIGFANRVVDTFIPRIVPLALLAWLKHEQAALMAALFAHITGLFTLG